MKRLSSALILCVASTAAAHDFSPNDVSILLEAPISADEPHLKVPDSAISPELANKAGTVIDYVNGLPTAVQTIDASLLTKRRDQWHVASIRIDPGAPGTHESFAAFGRNLQIRLVVQPVDFKGGAQIRDEAIHLIYTFGSAVSEAEREAARCPFRVLPSQQDIDAFQAALDDLASLRDELAAMGVDTAGAPLGVHPAFRTDKAADLLVDRLEEFLSNHLSEERLSALSIAGLPPGAPEPWIFLALRRTSDGFGPVPGPAIEQPPKDGGVRNFQQMLSFAEDSNGAVVPPGRTRNLMPVDCLSNFVLAELSLPQPEEWMGVSTSTLFGSDANTSAKAAGIAEVIADPAAAHFFNTDCVSCHTETRREMDAGSDPVRVGQRIARREGIFMDDLPRSPDDMPSQAGHWNVRAFGWFPGFPPTSARAHATVTRRTARETADVVACLNEGDWKSVDRPCIRPDTTTPIEQGWSDQIRRLYYHTSQGGEIMPLVYFLALAEPGGSKPFASPENLARYGLLRSEKDGHNPFGLPVGFAVTGEAPDAQVSLNCAACHSGDVVVGNTRLRVDGAPSSFDFDSFATDLARAVQETAQMDFSDPSKPDPKPRFKRFMATVGAVDKQALDDQAAFVQEFLAFATEFSGLMAQRRPAYPSGPGRVDALTQIVNALAVKDLGIATNLATPTAPTSYPALWLVDRLEYVQWNLTVADPLSRNIGQALGVFGKAELSGDDLFASSADREALERNEEWVSDLSPPPWPEKLLAEVNSALAEKGQDLFVEHCEGCHNAPPFRETSPEENRDGDTFIKVSAIPASKVQTDSEYTRSFTQRWVSVGKMTEPLGLPPHAPAAAFLSQVVGKVTAKALEGQAGVSLRLRPAGHPDCRGAEGPCGYSPPMGGAALKAGPLIGLWATGPYLHNGSVRTVYQVISPPKERETEFFIGDRTLDDKHLGFANTEVEGAFLFDTRIPGNGNGGHDFWDEPLQHRERMAIIEYLKDPGRFPVKR